jgi:glycosyltransferase involved in cell wall biosynthesis
MSERRLFVHATNVHQGGGRALLLSIMEALPGTASAVFSLDERMKLPDSLAWLSIKQVKPSIVHRFKAERWLARQVEADDMVLCFGNLPPLFKLRGRVTVFLQNRYLIDDVGLEGFPFKTRMRLRLERWWLSARMSNVDEFIVQTPSMKRLLEARSAASVQVLPFMARHEEYVRKTSGKGRRANAEFDFLYIASGEPHKNHCQLIEAWCLLAEQGMFPSLKLTLDNRAFPELCGWMEQKVARYRLNVENLGLLPHEKVMAAYERAGALIYPSTFESFGLPLIEARQAGLSILASELDYVRDVIDPEETFDPYSAVSIMRSVKRYLGKEEAALPLQDAAGFLKYILERVERRAHTHR